MLVIPHTPTNPKIVESLVVTKKEFPSKLAPRFRMRSTQLALSQFSVTVEDPVEFQLGDFADGYSLMNAQVTKVFSSKFEVYLGGENLTAVRQDNPVLGAQDPFGPNFDTSIVFAPILGRMVYMGFRFKS